LKEKLRNFAIHTGIDDGLIELYLRLFELLLSTLLLRGKDLADLRFYSGNIGFCGLYAAFFLGEGNFEAVQFYLTH
jgi:hypothetical protein